ncbi:YlmC/YmxH family sporulation protein [Clostridium botulinum]|nr:YlmC/YmxH family sporulation protein [Clostridium botulinum]
MPLCSINNLRMMEVIDVSTGSKLGYIKDFLIDCIEYKILSLIIPREKSSIFSKDENIEISWSKIIKIGVDVILIDIGEEILQEE